MKNPYHHRNIADIGDILNPAHVLRKDNCRKNCDSGIFGSADGNLAVERLSAVDIYLIHPLHSLKIYICKKR